MPNNIYTTIQTNLVTILPIPIASKVDLLKVVSLIDYILLVLLPPKSPLAYSTVIIVILLIYIYIQLIILLTAI
jgi:hypothetical protein